MRELKHGDIIWFEPEAPIKYRVSLQDVDNIILECIESDDPWVAVGQLFEGYHLAYFDVWNNQGILYYMDTYECFDCRKIFRGDIHYLCSDCQEKQGIANHLTSAYGSARLAHIRSCWKSTAN